MNLNNPPSICLSDCYICMEKMFFEDYAPERKQRMQRTCGDVKHQCCLGCFNKLISNECPYCRQPLLDTPKALMIKRQDEAEEYFVMLSLNEILFIQRFSQLRFE